MSRRRRRLPDFGYKQYVADLMEGHQDDEEFAGTPSRRRLRRRICRKFHTGRTYTTQVSGAVKAVLSARWLEDHPDDMARTR